MQADRFVYFLQGIRIPLSGTDGVLLRSVLVVALSDGGKEFKGFIDDLFHSSMYGRFKVRSTGGMFVG